MRDAATWSSLSQEQRDDRTLRPHILIKISLVSLLSFVHSFISQENHSNTQRSNAHLTFSSINTQTPTLEHRYRCTSRERTYRDGKSSTANETMSMLCYLTSNKTIAACFANSSLCGSLAAMLLDLLRKLAGRRGIELKVDAPRSIISDRKYACGDRANLSSHGE